MISFFGEEFLPEAPRLVPAADEGLPDLHRFSTAMSGVACLGAEGLAAWGTLRESIRHAAAAMSESDEFWGNLLRRPNLSEAWDVLGKLGYRVGGGRIPPVPVSNANSTLVSLRFATQGCTIGFLVRHIQWFGIDFVAKAVQEIRATQGIADEIITFTPLMSSSMVLVFTRGGETGIPVSVMLSKYKGQDHE
jgi:hypothetical protein